MALMLAWLLAPSLAKAQAPTVKIGAAVSLQGSSFADVFGRPEYDGVRLAIEEANANGAQPHLEIEVYDDQSSDDRAAQRARSAIASDDVVMVGPMNTTSVLKAAPIYAQAGLVALLPTAVPEVARKNATTFTTLFSSEDGAGWVANFLHYLLDATAAVVLVRDDGYGRSFAAGFTRAAERLGIAATVHAFHTNAEAQAFAQQAAADPEHPAVVLGLLADDAKTALLALRRGGAKGPIIGSNPIAGVSFGTLFRDQPEERHSPGFFTEGVYAVSPVMLDSANAETLAFASRFRARFGYEPSWIAVQGYDAARLAATAVRATPGAGSSATADAGDVRRQRDAIAAYLAAIDGPQTAVASMSGPLWFTPDRGRLVAPRLGRFHHGEFESAPVQLVSVSTASRDEIASDALLEVGPGHFARRQQVVYTGIFLNEVPRVDIAQSTFTADFYLWVRFAGNMKSAAADPSDIDFPDLTRGSFDAAHPAEQGELDDGTVYRLWRVRGDFKNDFDLHHYPLDRQTLALRIFNAKAASDRIVYVQDRWSLSSTATGSGPGRGIGAGQTAAPAADFTNVAPTAYRNLTQWEPLASIQRRDILVTESALGNPRLADVERVRELSGFSLIIDLRRRVVSTLVKTLLPLGLMALIMFASLYFPPLLVKEKVTVAITAALSGAVLLGSINGQLGNVGYVIAVEYVFYLFFTLCLLCIVLVLAAERLRVASKAVAAAWVERVGRYSFLAGLLTTVVAAFVAYYSW